MHDEDPCVGCGADTTSYDEQRDWWQITPMVEDKEWTVTIERRIDGQDPVCRACSIRVLRAALAKLEGEA